MSEAEVANHTVEILLRLNASIQLLTLEIGDLKGWMSDVEQGVASASMRMGGVEVSMAGVMNRMDERLGRIERRLELRDDSED